MNTRLAKTISAAMTIALAVLGLVGCGPAPGYETTQPQVPVGYSSLDKEPLTNEDLAARGPVTAPGGAAGADVAIGEGTDYADADPAALTEFQPALEGHGRWVDDATYGTVWVPAASEVGTDFQPYVTAGHWTYDDNESWVWVSDYDWGWAPFHYGRWVYVSSYGWSWIPGRRYSGAWVVWRTGPVGYGYVGWAPAPPLWYWRNGYALGWTYGWGYPNYVYCSHDYLYHPAVATYVVQGPAARGHESNTRPFVPASPSVGGREVASPSVGGRDLASPGVGGRSIAGPVVGSRATASPSVGARGPRPDELGIRQQVVRPPSDDRGLARARAAAVPRPRAVEPRFGDSRPAAYATRSPYVASRLEPAARAPQVAGVAPSPPRPPSFTQSRPYAAPYSPPSSDLVPRAPLASQGPLVSPYRTPDPTPQAPSYRSSPGSPSSRSSFGPTSPLPSAPTYRSSPSASMPSYRSTPSAPSSPSFRSSPSPSFGSSPSFRSSPSVGSSPSFRSSPSVGSSPSFRSSSPSSSPARSFSRPSGRR